MTKAKPILYGVSDFVLMRTKGAYYIDRTAYIRELENTRYVMFLRPRRFGKSLLVSMLQCYYDVHYAARFDELFSGLAIHDDPTPETLGTGPKLKWLNSRFSSFLIGLCKLHA